MNRKLYINNVYMVLTCSFIILLLPSLSLLMNRIELVTASELIMMIGILTLGIYCLIQSIEYLQVTSTQFIYKSLYEKKTFDLAAIKIIEKGKQSKRSMAGAPYLVHVLDKQTGNLLCEVSCYSFSKRYKTVIAYLKSRNIEVAGFDEVLSKR